MNDQHPRNEAPPPPAGPAPVAVAVHHNLQRFHDRHRLVATGHAVAALHRAQAGDRDAIGALFRQCRRPRVIAALCRTAGTR